MLRLYAAVSQAIMQSVSLNLTQFIISCLLLGQIGRSHYVAAGCTPPRVASARGTEKVVFAFPISVPATLGQNLWVQTSARTRQATHRDSGRIGDWTIAAIQGCGYQQVHYSNMLVV